MKRFVYLRKLYLSVTATIVAVTSFTACEHNESPAVPPTAPEIKIEATSSESISFVITPGEGTSVLNYACVPTADTSSAVYIQTDGAVPFPFTSEGLQPDTEYTVMAYGENIDGLTSPVAKVSAITSSEPQISISLIENTATSVTFEISAVNAAEFNYGVLRSSDAVEGNLTGTSKEVGGITVNVDTLAPSTSYAIAAEAVNASGERSHRKTVAFKTDILATVSIGEITTDLTSAVIPLVWNNAETVHYAVYHKDDSPVEYEVIQCGNQTHRTLSIYELEGNTEYRITTYAVSTQGNSGDTVSADFTTVEVVSDRKVTVSDITSYDAKFTVEWDEDTYSGCKWYAALASDLQDPSVFNWEEAIGNYTAKTVYGNGTSVNLSSFQPVSSENYRVGFVFLNQDGSPLLESAIWKDVQLDRIRFGESDCTAELDILSASFFRLRYTVRSNGAAQYYFGTCPSQYAEDLESYALSLLKNPPSAEFDITLVDESLAPGADYTAVVVPVDGQGHFGAINAVEFTCEEVAFNGSGELRVELISSDWVSATFDVSFGSNTQQVIKYSSLVPAGSEDEILTNLEYYYGRYGHNMQASGEVIETASLTTYTGNTLYCYFAAMDEAGRFSDLHAQEIPLKDIVFDGEGSVSVSIDNVSKIGNLYEIDYTLTPDSNVDYYYYRVVSKWDEADMSDEYFVVQTVSSGLFQPVRGTVQAHSPNSGEPSISNDYYIMILPVDVDGRLCTPIRYFIEETSTNQAVH